MEAASANAQQISSQGIWSMALAGATAAAIGVGFSLLLTRRIVQPQSAITIGATARNRWIEIFVTDRGAGIPLEYQSKIFNKFVQVKTEKDVGGSGLGLAICKEMVQAHGGRIWVNSTVGEGSTFTFTIPKSHS